jgi:hypothetical protein
LLYISYEEREAEPAAEKTQYDTEREFEKISPIPLAAPGHHHSMHKTHQGVVSTEYKTELGYGEIRAFYDKELTSQGWRFAREREVIYDGQDSGGKELRYCKGGYAAGLQYAGRLEKEFGWTYTFALTWGLSDECK